MVCDNQMADRFAWVREVSVESGFGGSAYTGR